MYSRLVMLLWTGMVMVAPGIAAPQVAEQSFLSDYSKLKAAPDNPFDELYIAPDALQRASQYSAIMIDQPELFIHPDSPYKGIKPDDMKAIADDLRERVVAQFKGGYAVVDRPGPNVLYVRLAVGDLMLEKKKRPILAYTPIGAVVHATRDITSKMDLNNMKIELELLDSTNQTQLGALTMSRGSLSSATADPAQKVTWEELDHVFSAIGKRLRCRLDNSKLPQAQQQNCGAIGLAPPPTTTTTTASES